MAMLELGVEEWLVSGVMSKLSMYTSAKTVVTAVTVT